MAGEVQFAAVKAELARWLPETNVDEARTKGSGKRKAKQRGKKARAVNSPD